jgi:acetyl esterase/lipase
MIDATSRLTRTFPLGLAGLPIAALVGFLALPATAQIPVYEGPAPTAIAHYGDDPLQFGALRLPEGPGPFPLAVTIHGGCWLSKLGEGSLTPAAAALTDAGVATWDVEYRKLGEAGGGWPGTFLDVGASIDHLRELAGRYPIDLERVVLVGHSSGAQLAVWAAGRGGLPLDSDIRGDSPLPVRAAVGIDGPMDLTDWSEKGRDVEVCGNAVERLGLQLPGPVIESLLGGPPSMHPRRYRQASPARMPRIDAAVFLNPSGMMLGFGDPDGLSERAKTTGERVTVRAVPDSDHFQLITTTEESWTVVFETILAALGSN